MMNSIERSSKYPIEEINTSYDDKFITSGAYGRSKFNKKHLLNAKIPGITHKPMILK